MSLGYLANSLVDQSVLDARNSDYFLHATRDARLRDENHADAPNSRYDIATNPDILLGIMRGYKAFMEFQDIPYTTATLLAYLNKLESLFSRDSQIIEINETQKILLKTSLHLLLGNDINAIDIATVLGKIAPLIRLGEALHIKNQTTATDALLINGGPLEEMAQRVKDATSMILTLQPKIVVLSGGNTQNIATTTSTTEADYLKQMIAQGLGEQGGIQGFSLENSAKNTGENMQLVSQELEGRNSVTITTTDYDSLRVLLTAQRQMPFSGQKRVHGSDFLYSTDGLQVRPWSSVTWWLTEDGWRATMYALSRLVNYRARTEPFL